MESGGSFLVISQLNPTGTDRFFALAKQIAADFATRPVSADELARAVGPLRQQIARASSGSSFWLSQLSGISSDPRKGPALLSLPRDYARITPEELQATAKRWLVPGKAFTMVVVPAK